MGSGGRGAEVEGNEQRADAIARKIACEPAFVK